MTYEATRESENTRQQIANLYHVGISGAITSDQVIITQGAIVASSLLFHTLVGPKDHVICMYPTYEQLYEVPKSLGADVSLWNLTDDDAYIPNVQELHGLVRNNTKMIIINNPNSFIGATIPRSVLEGIAAFARSWNIIVMANEIYRPPCHSLPAGESMPTSILSLRYKKVVSTLSMSKASSVVGICPSWIASRDHEIIKAVKSARKHTTISVPQLDERITENTLTDAASPNLLKRGIEIARMNLKFLDPFVQKPDSTCPWLKPTAGTTAVTRFLCLAVLSKKGVPITPGPTCLRDSTDCQGQSRFGYVCREDAIKDAMEKLGKHLEDNFNFKREELQCARW